MSVEITIIRGSDPEASQPNYLRAFERLNREWLEAYFRVERCDEEVFADVKARILDPGGILIFAELDHDFVGCGALIATGDGGFELAKMAVTQAHRGKGLGKAMMDALLEYAVQTDATYVTLVTNSTLKAAIGLYQSRGFSITHEGQHEVYERGDVVMNLKLTSKSS